MKQILLSALFWTATWAAALATVPVRRTLTHTQPDGTTLTVQTWANGHYTVYSTIDNISILRGSDGHFYYAEQDGNLPKASLNLAHNPALRQAHEQLYLGHSALTKATAISLMEQAWENQPVHRNRVSAKASTSDGLGAYMQTAGGAVNSIGEHTIPVVMVEFADRAFQDTVTIGKVSRFFNEEGYADENLAKGSVRDYFLAQSQGIFSPRFEVTAKVTLSQGYAYYGKNSANGFIDEKMQTFVQEALDLASETVDFAPYMEDGKVPLVVFMFAGPGEQSSYEDGYTDYIWAKFMNGYSHSANEGKVKIQSTFVGNELLQSYKTPNEITDAHMDGIGVFCHEFGHAIGLCDTYYTGSDVETGRSLKTMGYWDIMDYGQYMYNGYRPAGYLAYERSYLGWLKVEELTEPAFVSLYPYSQSDKGPAAYILRNDENPNEYYLLENRQKDLWNSSMLGEGMLITHVDYNQSVWSGNRLNNDPEHPRLAFVPADNVKEGTRTNGGTLAQLFDGYKGDLFPGTANVTAFTDDSEPAAILYTGEKEFLGKPLYNIQRSDDGIVSFSFIDPELTGLDHVVNEADAPTNTPIFNLSGGRMQSLDQAPAGVYIQGGKKIIRR